MGAGGRKRKQKGASEETDLDQAENTGSIKQKKDLEQENDFDQAE